MFHKLNSLLICSFFISIFVKAQPTISNISPLRARIDSNVTITGSNFIAHADSNIVYFGPVKANIVSATTTQIVAKVPRGAAYDPISVTSGRLTVETDVPFNVAFPSAGILTSASFATKFDSSSLQNPHSFTSCDFDGDGKVDLAVGHFTRNCLSIYRNTTIGSTTSFARMDTLSTPFGSLSRIVTTADINGDGKKDLIYVNAGFTSVVIYRNTSTLGAISFAAPISLAGISGNPVGLACDDIDGDRKPDIVLGGYTTSKFSIFRNTSTINSISFSTRQDYNTLGTFPVNVVIADMNNDGKKDLLIANSQNYNISIFQNFSVPGTIILATSFEYATNFGVHDFTVADLNNDGFLDILATDFSSAGDIMPVTTFCVLRNNMTNTGTASFTANSFDTRQTFNTNGIRTHGIRAADFDGDGFVDICVGHLSSNFISLYKNLSNNGGAIVLSTKVDFTTPSNPLNMVLSDFNNDGRVDIATTNYNSSSISVFTNSIPILNRNSLLVFVVRPINNVASITINYSDVNSYESVKVEHSIDGINWQEITNISNIKTENKLIHGNPSKGKNLYRLRQHYKNGNIDISDIRVVNFGKNVNNILIYPNPIINNKFSLDLGQEISSKIQYYILEINGKMLESGFITQRQSTIQLKSSSKGNLVLVIPEFEKSFKLISQ